ncbi:MAG: ABC1 kinase family protein [Methylobacter sp.]
MSPLNVTSFLRKARHWYRIGLSMRRLKRVKDAEREFAQQALSKALGEARGLAMKIGQFMAGFDDSNPYHHLIVSLEPLPLTALKPALATSLNRTLEQVFQRFDEAAVAASLGQVHHAQLLNGDEVAVKIRYPGIIEAVKAELSLLDCLPAAGPVKQWRINTSDYKNTLRRQLLRETDYLIEMQTQQRFKQKLRAPGLHIPEVFPELCSDAVLIQTWETGSCFSDACTWPKKDRLEIGKTLLMTLFQSLFVTGEVHGDPHPGNYLFRHDAAGNPQTVLLDFGCTVLIRKQSRLAFLRLIDACRKVGGRDFEPLKCFAAMGFDAEKLGHLQDDLPQLCNLLMRPFLAEKPFHVEQWRLSTSMKELLDERRWWFRAAGPADLFLLLRAFHGLSQQLEKLDVALPWWPLLHHVVGDQLLAQARTLELPAIAEPQPDRRLTYDRARKLCVRLVENGVICLSTDLPAEAAFDLESIMPEQVLSTLLSNSKVDLAELNSRLRNEGLLSQQLFNDTIGTRQCRVWLE